MIAVPSEGVDGEYSKLLRKVKSPSNSNLASTYAGTVAKELAGMIFSDFALIRAVDFISCFV